MYPTVEVVGTLGTGAGRSTGKAEDGLPKILAGVCVVPAVGGPPKSEVATGAKGADVENGVVDGKPDDGWVGGTAGLGSSAWRLSNSRAKRLPEEADRAGPYRDVVIAKYGE